MKALRDSVHEVEGARKRAKKSPNMDQETSSSLLTDTTYHYVTAGMAEARAWVRVEP